MTIQKRTIVPFTPAGYVTFFVALSLAIFTSGCWFDSNVEEGDNEEDVKIENPEGDATVPAELGGPGFKGGEGWHTANPGPLGDPRAVKGGSILTNYRSWPGNLRMYGTEANTFLNSIIETACYESLCSTHPNTLEALPSLASHWWISEDNMKFKFRINPKAHWSDGKPVTAEDILATYRLIMDPTLTAPMSRESLSKLKEPIVKSKYMLEIECKTKHWRNFLTISGMIVLPAHEIGSITGKEYLEKYNYQLTTVSGPYDLKKKDIIDNESLTLTRRKNYWGKDKEMNQGLNNIDRIRFKIVREDRTAFDMMLKGEFDFYVSYTSKWWVEDLPRAETIQKGYMIPRLIYTRYPQGFQGQAFNMRKPPLDDVRVRKALCHLYDRKTMLEKFAYNAYPRLKSYYPASDAENPSNKMVEYDPTESSRLLDEAGWSGKGPDGIRIKDGKRLSFSLTYRSKGLEKYLTSYKEAAKKVGVELRLTLADDATHWKNVVNGRKFEIAGMNWGAILFPNPKSNYLSKMADEPGSNNLPGFKSEEADKIIEQYDQEFDLAKRTELLKKLDSIIFNAHPYALEWFMPYQRIVYSRKFGTPEHVLHRYSDWREVFFTFWVDPENERELKEAKKSGETLKPIPPMEDRFWLKSDRSQASLN